MAGMQMARGACTFGWLRGGFAQSHLPIGRGPGGCL